LLICLKDISHVLSINQSYLICFSREEGVWELDVPLVVHLLRWFICLLGRGSFHFVPCIPPSFGLFGSFKVSTVSSSHPFLWFYLEQNFCPHFVCNLFSWMNSILHFNPEFSCWRWYLHGSYWTVIHEFFLGVLPWFLNFIYYLVPNPLGCHRRIRTQYLTLLIESTNH